MNGFGAEYYRKAGKVTKYWQTDSHIVGFVLSMRFVNNNKTWRISVTVSFSI